MAANVRLGSVQEDQGPLPEGISPGMFHAFGDPDSLRNDFITLGAVNSRGALRADFTGPFLGESHDLFDLLAKIRTELTAPGGLIFGKALRNGLIVLMSSWIFMPAWLSNSNDSTSIPAASGTVSHMAPPRDYSLFESVNFELAKMVYTEFPTLAARILWDFKNEIDSLNFWRGTRDELFRTYGAFDHGIRRGALAAGYTGTVKVGGMNFAAANAKAEYTSPESFKTLLAQWLEWCNDPINGYDSTPTGQVRPDFLSYHSFGDDSVQVIATEVSRIAEQNGVSASIPQYLTEFNMTLNPLVARDGARGASHCASMILRSPAKGITRSIYALGATGLIVNPTGFNGDYGAATVTPLCKKPIWLVQEMLSRLLPRKISLRSTDSDFASWEVFGIATASNDATKRALLIARHVSLIDLAAQNQPIRVLYNYLNDIGYAGYFGAAGPSSTLEYFSFYRQSTGIGFQELTNYINVGTLVTGAYSLPSYLPAATAADLAVGKAMALTADSVKASNVTVSLEIMQRDLVSAWRLYRIRDSDAQNNAKKAFDNTVGGSGYAAAVTAAQAQQALTPQQTGTGVDIPTSLTLEPYEVCLLELDGLAPLVDTRTGARLNPAWNHL